MSKQVIFNIVEGNFNDGFTILFQIIDDKYQVKTCNSKFPGNPELFEAYQTWRRSYEHLDEVRKFIFPDVEVTHIAGEERGRVFKEATNSLKRTMRVWLQQTSFEALLKEVLDDTSSKDALRVIFQIGNSVDHDLDSQREQHISTLLRLPWHLWSLFEKRPNAEFLLSLRGDGQTSDELGNSVRILGVIGDRTGINPDVDRELIQNLRSKGAFVEWLDQPKRWELSDQLWDQHWDILFFAGHSSSLDDFRHGFIQLNETEKVRLSDLKHSFYQAVDKGLKLAIFNSCDGLGLANDLAREGLPYSIVMREPVPDRIAQIFLKYFIQYFSQPLPLHSAMRMARRRLADLESDFPVDWLPVICQRPGAPELIWFSKSSGDPNGYGSGFGKGDTKDNSPDENQDPSTGTKDFDKKNDPEDSEQSGGNRSSSDTTGKTGPNSHGDGSEGKDLPGKDSFSWGKISVPLIVLLIFFGGIAALLLPRLLNSNKLLPIAKSNPEDITSLWRTYLAAQKQPLNLVNLLNGISSQQTGGSVYSIGVVVQNEDDDQLLRGVAQAQLEQNCPDIKFEELQSFSQEELIENCQGRDNISFRVEYREDNAVPEQAVKFAQELLQTGVIGVVGHSNSPTTFAAYQDVYEDRQVVVAAPTSTAGRENMPYLFRTATNDAVAHQDIIDYLSRRVWNVDSETTHRVLIVSDSSDSYSLSFTEEITQALKNLKSVNVEIINPDSCKISESDFDPFECINALPEVSRSDVLLVVPGVKNRAPALSVIEKNVGSGAPKFSNLVLSDTMFEDIYNDSTNQALSNSLKAFNNIIFAVPWHGEGESKFEETALSMWKGEINWRSVTAYDAFTLIAEALHQTKQRKPSGNLTRQELYETLKSASLQGAIEDIQFDQNSDRLKSQNFGTIVRLEFEDDKFVFK
jgi:branched-chain amino acid transport system substrate-binding protein